MLILNYLREMIKNYLYQVIKYVKKFKINFIIPCSDEEAITLSNNLNKFKEFDISIVCQAPEVNKVICNKIRTYKLLEKNNISVPEFLKLQSQNLNFLNLLNFFYR